MFVFNAKNLIKLYHFLATITGVCLIIIILLGKFYIVSILLSDYAQVIFFTVFSLVH